MKSKTACLAKTKQAVFASRKPRAWFNSGFVDEQKVKSKKSTNIYALYVWKV